MQDVVSNEVNGAFSSKKLYYMARSASGQDEPNRATWLAARAGKMEPSCPLGNTRRIPEEKFPRKPYNKFFIDQVFSVKMVGYWPCPFFASLWTETKSRSINTEKKLGQYPAIFTTHLVSNEYELFRNLYRYLECAIKRSLPLIWNFVPRFYVHRGISMHRPRSATYGGQTVR